MAGLELSIIASFYGVYLELRKQHLFEAYAGIFLVFLLFWNYCGLHHTTDDCNALIMISLGKKYNDSYVRYNITCIVWIIYWKSNCQCGILSNFKLHNFIVHWYIRCVAQLQKKELLTSHLHWWNPFAPMKSIGIDKMYFTRKYCRISVMFKWHLQFSETLNHRKHITRNLLLSYDVRSIRIRLYVRDNRPPPANILNYFEQSSRVNLENYKV